MAQSEAPAWRDALLVVGATLLSVSVMRPVDLGDLIPTSVRLAMIAAGIVALGGSGVVTAFQNETASIVHRVTLCVLGACGFVAVAGIEGKAVCLLIVLSGVTVRWSFRTTVRWLLAPATLLALIVLASRFAEQFLLLIDDSALVVPVSIVTASIDALGGASGTGTDSASIASARQSCHVLASPGVLGLHVFGAVSACILFCELLPPRPRFGRIAIAALGGPTAAALIRYGAVLLLVSGADTFAEYDEDATPIFALMHPAAVVSLDFMASSVIFLAMRVSHGASGSRVVSVARTMPSFGPVSPWIVTGLAVFSGALLSIDRVADLAGTPKQGRIAVDEGHSRWESTDIELGTRYYGDETGYNFRALMDWLQLRHGGIKRLYEPLTAERLADIDVFLIKTPTNAYSEAEVRAIVDYVAAGGGLILIGDHTNVFGTSEVLNPICSEFGFLFRYDVLFDERATFEEVWSREARVKYHPVVKHVPQLRFEVGCTMSVESPHARSLIVGRGVKALPIDYTSPNYYPRIKDRSHMRTGPISQLLVRPFGKGRVVALADSTLLSTFSACYPGRRELVEGMVTWANMEDLGVVGRQSLKGLGLALCLTLLVLGRWQSSAMWVGMVMSGVIVGGGIATNVAGKWMFPGLDEVASTAANREVVFLADGREDYVEWPITTMVRDRTRSFDMFFQWTLRTGYFPRLAMSADEIRLGHGMVVCIEPRGWDPAGFRGMLEFVRSGGSLLLVETCPNETVSAIGSVVGLRLSEASELRMDVDGAMGRLFEAAQPCLWRSIDGGAALLTSSAPSHDEKVTVGAVAFYGEGSVAIITCGEMFADNAYGLRYNVIPTTELRMRYEFQFDLIRAGMRGSDGQ